jgi:hypothetical protein
MTGNDHIIEQIVGHLRTVESPAALAAFTEKMVGQLLRRDEDEALRKKTLERVLTFFGSPAGQVLSDETRNFAVEVVSIIMQIRHQRGMPLMTAEEIDGIYASLEEDPGAPIRGQAAEPTRIVIIPPHSPETYDSFEKLFTAALRYKVSQTVTFFQRWNPRVFRRIQTPFLLSTAFGAVLDRVIAEKIVPIMLESRTIRHIGTLYRWAETDSVAFWKLAEQGDHLKAIRKEWHVAWDRFRPLKVKQKQGLEEKTVLRAGPELRWLREALASDKYALPEIRSREIDLIASFIEPDATRESLEWTWTRLRQLYEQELDRRFYQDKARTGALRDSLLECFLPFSPRTAEFLSLLCYRNFPYLTLSFLEAFTHNHGSNDAARHKNIPFLMWYLSLPEAAFALEADERWIQETTVRDETRVREEAEREEQQRLEEMNAVVWSSR